MNKTEKNKKKTQRNRIFLIMLLIIVVGVFHNIVNFLADLSWFGEIGYQTVYFKRIFAKLYLALPIGFILFFVFLLYFKEIYKKFLSKFEIGEEQSDRKKVGIVIKVLSFVLAGLFSNRIASESWMKLLQFIYGGDFGVVDPVFHRDIGFYIFRFPFLVDFFAAMLNILVILFLVTFVFYLVLLVYKTPSLMSEKEENSNITHLYPGSRRKNIKDKILEMLVEKGRFFGSLFFVLVAAKSILRAYELLYSARGAVFGAGYTDVVINLWVYRFDALLAGMMALFLLFRKKNSKKALAIAVVLMVIANIGGAVAQQSIQSLVVAPNELSKEKPYIENAIKYTNLAYGLDKIQVREFDIQENLTVEDIVKNEETVSNISLNDYRPTKEAFNQLQGLRGYYKFNDVDIDRYILDGKLTQVFLSVREMDKSKLEDKAKNWINTKLKYTHGYGIAMAPVNQLTQAGQPDMIMKNVPVQSTYSDLVLQKPQVYFGELSSDYVIVNTKELEFDYPKGESNEMTGYEGRGGIPLNFWNRLLFSVKEKDFKLFISDNITEESRILIYRDVLSRVKKIAPFLTYDTDIYSVIADGKIMYIIDGYTVSSHYPYSERMEQAGGLNYIRNSFKAVVDSYDGDVNFYIVDDTDPILKTYAAIFPKLFQNMEQMPEKIKAHLRYPQYLFDIQSQIYATYHMSDPQVFYNREDKWDIPTEMYQGEERTMESIYSTYRIPGEKNAEFLLSIPYTPKSKQNLTGLLIARNDGDEYGKLLLYRMPKDKIVIGPQQMEGKFSNNDKISKDLSLWDSRGSEVLRGHILTIPIENSLLYIEPLYIRAAGENAIPEVKRIIVGYKDKIVMEETLAEALNEIFPSEGKEEQQFSGVQKPIKTSAEVSLTNEEKIKEANRKFEEAQEILKQGNLGQYQQKINEVGELLKQLEQENDKRE